MLPLCPNTDTETARVFFFAMPTLTQEQRAAVDTANEVVADLLPPVPVNPFKGISGIARRSTTGRFDRGTTTNYPAGVSTLGMWDALDRNDPLFRARVRQGLVQARLSRRIPLQEWEQDRLEAARKESRQLRSEERNAKRRAARRASVHNKGA